MGKGRKSEKISTLLGPDTYVEGTIRFEDTIRVDGRVKGRIGSGDGRVIIGKKASVHARIDAGVVIIMGEVFGAVEARDRVEIYPSGRVVGDISTPVITIDRGGILQGKCSMKVRSVSPRAQVASLVEKKSAPAG